YTPVNCTPKPATEEQRKSKNLDKFLDQDLDKLLDQDLGDEDELRRLLEEDQGLDKVLDQDLDKLLDQDLGDDDELRRLLEEEWGRKEGDLGFLKSDSTVTEQSSNDSEGEEDVWYDATEDPHTHDASDNFEGLELPYDEDFDAKVYRNW
ncbi:hypothetical protein BGZ70_008274, partial [Mortierella alpina]